VPRFVERELREFLDCGIPAQGVLRVHCDACGEDRLVAFSCKGRGFCPSCGGRRMADTAAHLVDRVLPAAPVRQWVLSLPFALRYLLAYDARLLGAVLRVPLEYETRGNIHVGGQCVHAELTPKDLEICEALAPLLKNDGLYFVGPYYDAHLRLPDRVPAMDWLP